MTRALRYDVVVVAEKPGVAKAFAEYLSNGRYRRVEVEGVRVYEFSYGGGRWASVGVRGHLMDFDFPREYNNWKSVNPRKLFFIHPVRVIRKGMWKYVKALRRLARSTKLVILALDADVEGEAIAFEVMEIMYRANPSLEFRRAWFSAVTRSDLLGALTKLRSPDRKLADKAFARMMLDLTIGAAFTRALTLMVERRNCRLPKGRFLSYGPCQTPVLYLVVRRALERESFVKKKFYEIVGEFEYDGVRFKAKLEKKFESRSEAESLAEELRSAGTGRVVKASYREKVVKPPEPLATVELERRASRFLDIRPKRVMEIAEDLYQEGLISYPRTDTTIYPPTLNLRALASKFVNWEDVGSYVRRHILSRSRITPRQGSEDDGAHPPIYPLKSASRNAVVGRFGEDGWKLYDLVVRHFLATLSPPMLVEKQEVVVGVMGVKLVARGLKVVDPGYTSIYPFEKPREAVLPYLLEGDELKILRINVVRAETRPPPYLSEAELLRLMKKYGIGTDATMQDHIHTNVKRKYFRVVRRRCIPTPLGRALALALQEVVPEALMPEVRGRMEASLKAIAEGLREPGEVVREVKGRFYEYLQRLLEAEERIAPILMNALKEVYSPSERSPRSSLRTTSSASRRASNSVD